MGYKTFCAGDNVTSNVTEENKETASSEKKSFKNIYFGW